MCPSGKPIQKLSKERYLELLKIAENTYDFLIKNGVQKNEFCKVRELVQNLLECE